METLLCRRTWPLFPSHPVVVSLCVRSSLSASCTSGVLSCLSAASPRRPRPWLCTQRLLGRVERVGGRGWSVPGTAFCMSFLGLASGRDDTARTELAQQDSPGSRPPSSASRCGGATRTARRSAPFSVLSSLRCLTGSGVCEAGFPASSHLPCLRGSGDENGSKDSMETLQTFLSPCFPAAFSLLPPELTLRVPH